MNNDFQEYKNKKRDMIQASCSCGANHYVFVNKNNCYSLCKKCGRKIFELSCISCETGFCYPDNVKEIDLIQNTWKCDQCNKINEGLPTLKVNGYEKSEIPNDVWKEDESRGIPKWIIWTIMLLVGAGMILRSLFR